MKKIGLVFILSMLGAQAAVAADCTMCALGPKVQTGTLDGATDSHQFGRIFRDGAMSACGGAKACPGVNAGNSGSDQVADVYAYTNSSASSQCMTILFDPNTATNGGPVCGINAHAIAYAGVYAPDAVTNPGTNETICGGGARPYTYLGDVGASITQPFAVDVPAGGQFSIVVHSNTSVPVTPCEYKFTITSCSGTQLELSSDPVDMGSVIDGAVGTLDVQVKSCGTGDLSFTSAALSGVDSSLFSITADTASGQVITPGDTRSLSFAYAPPLGSSGFNFTFLDIVSNDTETANYRTAVFGEVGDRPDLKISDLKASKSGGKLTCSFKVQNAGLGNAGASTVKIQSSKSNGSGTKLMKESAVAAIAAGAKSVKISSKKKTSHSRCIVTADSGAVIAEANETNNRSTKKVGR
ncbi:hypothetical protein JNK13_00800 [bacterium]|nr:hypothetical protein [bacterium]